jgi:chemotaxis regulatin CheY-phosphate phosphatase CheZ
MGRKHRDIAAAPTKRAGKRRKPTEIFENGHDQSFDLRVALAELLAPKSIEALGAFYSSLNKIRAGFDPAQITMTSTNIPDAIKKLTSVLTETNAASHRVFALIDQLSTASCELDSFVNRFCQSGLETNPDREALRIFNDEHCRRHREIQALAHEVVIAQGAQDLCGQNITKVITLLCELEAELRSLFAQVRVPIPSSEACSNSEQDIDQSFADSVFKCSLS